MTEIDRVIFSASIKRANIIAWELIRSLVETDEESDLICATKVYDEGLNVSYKGQLVDYNYLRSWKWIPYIL